MKFKSFAGLAMAVSVCCLFGGNLASAEALSITNDNLAQFVYFGGPLRLGCWKDSGVVVRVLASAPAPGAQVKVLKADKLVRSLKRKIKLLSQKIKISTRFSSPTPKGLKKLKQRKRLLAAKRSQLKAARTHCEELAQTFPDLPNGQSSSEYSTSLQSSESSAYSSSQSSSSSSLPDGLWQPPIGLPRPAFGLEETVESIYGSDGYFTHYVDASQPNATDTNNSYGSPSLPRRTVPSSLPAGSVVYLAGGVYSASAMAAITAGGSALAPVFLRGNRSAPPTITIETTFKGNYFIIENIDFNGPSAQVNILGPSQHIALRHSTVRNAGGSGAGVCVVGSWNSANSTLVSDIVLYNNKLHDLGDMSAEGDQDHHGVVIGHHAHHVWMVDNEIYNTSGSGLQINSGFLDETGDRPAHHIFVGRNHVYQTRQSGLAVKKARDIVFSQNHIHHVIDTPWSTGKALGFQYGPYNMWFIYNILHDTTWGINGPSNDGGPGGGVYLIGNIIYDCDIGMIFWNNLQTAHMVANTVVRVNTGIHYDNGPGMHLKNNIFAYIPGYSIVVKGRSGATAAASTTTHDLFYRENGTVIFEWGGVPYNSLAALQAATGKGAGNIEADPKFIDLTQYNFRLLSQSPAINAGLTPELYQQYFSFFGENIAVDHDLKPRNSDIAHDLGAFEY